MGAGFGVDRDSIGAGRGEGFQIGVGRRDHQMDVERPRGEAPQAFDDRRPKRNVGHEMTVHDVEMVPVGAGLLDRADLFGKPREIGGEDRRRDCDFTDHPACPFVAPRRRRSRLAARRPIADESAIVTRAARLE